MSIDEKDETKSNNEPSPADRRGFYIAVIGFSLFGVLIFFQLLASETWAPLAWGGLAFVIFFMIFPEMGARILFITLGLIMLYGFINIMDSSSRNEKIREHYEGPRDNYRR